MFKKTNLLIFIIASIKSKLISFAIILILGFVLRVVSLDISPPGFNADEAALGYNAYSLIKTGKDEWGETFPFVFKSFGDYKPGLYVYMAIPFIVLFGLTELAVRFPSIILGVLSILLIYKLAKIFFEREVVALSTAFLLAISPWHIHFSRGAWETNVGTFFILLGVLTFLKGLKNDASSLLFHNDASSVLLRNDRWLIVSAISFVLSIYAYQSTRLIVPLLILGIGILFIKQINFKKIIVPSAVGFILLIPILLILFSNKGLSRFQGVSIFSDLGPLNRVNELRGQHSNPNSLQAKIFHNKFVAYGNNFLGHYFDHFTPDFLLFKGDPLKRNKVPETGQMYFFEILTIIFGLYLLISRKYSYIRIIPLWLIIAPIAAALTYQTPHALRAHNMVIPLTLISGLGLGELIILISKTRVWLKNGLFMALVLIIGYFVINYLHQYYIHLPKAYALEWEYGFKELIPFIQDRKDNYDKVVITTRYDQPYILYLFYTKYDPESYQAISKTEGDNNFGFITVSSFDNLEFKRFAETDVVKSKKTLFIGTNDEIGKEGDLIREFKFPNGNNVFRVVESENK